MDSIIFDLDGTLWDSTETVAKAWSDCIARESDLQMVITSERLHSLFGQLLPDIARQLFPDETPQRQLELIDLCCEEENRALLHNPGRLYPRLEETLQILSERCPLYIVSNCQAGYIEVFLESTGLGKYFQGHLCPGDTGLAKAENIRLIAEKNHLQSPVYVGDTKGDFEASQKAGVPFIFASYGFGEVAQPDAVIREPFDLTTLSLD